MLTDKRQAFVDAYLECWNASEAARVAGYAVPRQEGSRLLSNVDIQDEIQRRVNERAMTADEVLLRLAAMARGNIGDFFSIVPDREFPVLDMKKAYAAGNFKLIKKIKYSAEGAMEFELYDAQAALVQLGKFHKVIIERSEVSGAGGGPIKLEALQRSDLSKLDVAELEALRGIVAKATGNDSSGVA
jgi:hypothetical protein